MLSIVSVHCEQGALAPARAVLAANESFRDHDNPTTRASYAAVEARLLRAQGHDAEALAAAERALALRGELSVTDNGIKLALVEAIEAALALNDLDQAEAALAIPESLDPGELTPFLQANTARLRARLDAAHGRHEGVEERFRAAAGLFREFDLAFHLAVTQLEHAEWLGGQGRTEEAHPLVAEARQAFEQLQAVPWLERVARAFPAERQHEAAVS
jgi:tetratricopeptide (TPR) repeat protein